MTILLKLSLSIHFINLPRHGGTSQALCITLLPIHGSPPPIGVGLSHSLVLVCWIFSPQVAEQGVQSDQTPQPPSPVRTSQIAKYITKLCLHAYEYTAKLCH